MNDFENDLKTTINSLMDAIVKENESKYVNIVNDIVEVIEKSPYDFTKPEIYNTMIAFPLEEIMSNIVFHLHKQQNDGVQDKFKPQFIFLHYQFLSSNIEKFIEERMGTTSCIVDKSRHIIKVYLNYALTGEIEPTDLEEHYWIPKFGTNEEWVEFCDGLYRLFYGNNDKYLHAYNKLLNAEIRRFPHTLYTLSAIFTNGVSRIIETSYDNPILIPPSKNGCYIISKTAFDEKVPYENAEDSEIYLGRFFYKVPENDISKFSVNTKEVML